MEYDDDTVFVMTEWQCLKVTLSEYGIDTDSITPAVGRHMVDDFMGRMIRAGHIGMYKDNN